jgi:hypothetical protein
MTIQGKEELFDEGGCLPVWGHKSATGKIYYTFQLTNEDKYIMFPCTINNPKAPKFQLRKTDNNKYDTSKGEG